MAYETAHQLRYRRRPTQLGRPPFYTQLPSYLDAVEVCPSQPSHFAVRAIQVDGSRLVGVVLLSRPVHTPRKRQEQDYIASLAVVSEPPDE